ncbi:ABC transporter permease [Anatilimnocola floriformis]|uniref:ABC transporter permease n=1 Tax=Anatilimnocola floriformis TaxID=2948575 RepID=UPI0020C55F0F|nr:ABC transporter permease [Anatilimnocola floriformis]
MNWIALRMLMGDRAKYFGLIFGVAFATLLMSQQVSIFMGIIRRTASQITDVRDCSIWVMDEKARYIDEVPALPDTDVYRVRGVEGVEWAVRLYYGQNRARLEDGNFRNLLLYGVDDETMVAAPQQMIVGKLDDLRQPDAVIIDKAGYEYMWPGEEYKIGRSFELNDRRAVLVGVCKASPPFVTLPVLYSRYSQAVEFVPHRRNLMSFVLVQHEPSQNPEEVCKRIERQTGLMALTQDQFFWKTVFYFLGSTGIPVNFGITITLGFIVGAAITGQTFYLFTIENLRQFGALKAMGVSNFRLIGMILLQAIVVGLLGYGIGIGLTAAFFVSTSGVTHLAGLNLTPLAAGGCGVAVLLIIVLTSLVAMTKVLVLEPAVVFRG